LLRLITRDPASGGELVVTRLESPESGVVIEGDFSFGWIGLLSPEQIDFVGLLLRHRANVQKVAAEVGISYNTARSRLDEIVAALGGSEAEPDRGGEVLGALSSGEIDFQEALRRLKD
jgi:hypothetical protein